MKLKIREFENFAKRSGKKANIMFVKLGGGKRAYKRLKKGCPMGYDIAREIYNELGEQTFLSIVDLEEETINGFKAKYIVVGNKLY